MCRAGDVLVVTKLDRLAWSLRDATDIEQELNKEGRRFEPRGAVYDTTGRMGQLLFIVLGMVAKFEADGPYRRRAVVAPVLYRQGSISLDGPSIDLGISIGL